jgi:H+-transporting ATPase
VFALHPNHYMPGWMPFFKMPVLMLMLITLLNDGTLVRGCGLIGRS